MANAPFVLHSKSNKIVDNGMPPFYVGLDTITYMKKFLRYSIEYFLSQNFVKLLVQQGKRQAFVPERGPAGG